jgi:predicted membrane protein
VLTVATPVAVFVLVLFALYTFLVHAADSFHIILLVVTAAVLMVAVFLAAFGVPMAVCLVVLMLAPLITVVGYETIGHRHMVVAVQRSLAHEQ